MFVNHDGFLKLIIPFLITKSTYELKTSFEVFLSSKEYIFFRPLNIYILSTRVLFMNCQFAFEHCPD